MSNEDQPNSVSDEVGTDTSSSEESTTPYGGDIAELSQRMEALLFVSSKPMSARRLADLLETGGSVLPIREAAALIEARCEGHAFELAEFGGGYLMQTRPAHEDTVLLLQRQRKAQKLTPGAMETLSVIAYKQPITRAELDGIRGVSSDHHVRTLSERDLIKVTGRTESKGFGNQGSALYGTTNEFLNAFGLKHLSQLPTSEDLSVIAAEENLGTEPDPASASDEEE